MHIDPNSSTHVHTASATLATTLSAGQGGRSTGPNPEYADGIQLSRLSSVLNGLAAGAAAGAKRISSLSALVQSGAYQVRPLQVSQRMIDDALSPQ
jgi:hypothetical protein